MESRPPRVSGATCHPIHVSYFRIAEYSTVNPSPKQESAKMLPWIRSELASLEIDGLLRTRRTFQPQADGWCLVNGQRLRNFSANDYLGLAHDPRVLNAAQEALSECGCGAGASALVSGRTRFHRQLEEKLASFEGEEAAILFPTGYAANLGVVSALVTSDDVVFCDRFNHASLVDGCRLSGAQLRVYRHGELEGLKKSLEKSTGDARRWIISDGVFSMDGDLAPLPELCDLAEKYDVRVIIDEAHGTGLFGTNGRGACEHWGVEDRVAVRVGTLSKAIGTLGGFVAGSRELIDWLWNRARTGVFSTALPPAICAAANRAIEIIETEPQRRAELLERAAAFRDQLTQANVPICRDVAGPIIPVIVGEAERTTQLAKNLEARGFLVAAIRPPTVPRETSRLRISLSSSHVLEDIQLLADALIAELDETSIML